VTAWPGVLGTDTSTPIALIGGRVVDPDSDTDGLQDLVLVDGRLIATGVATSMSRKGLASWTARVYALRRD